MTMRSLPIPPTIPTDALCWCRSFPADASQASDVRRFVAFLLDGCAKADDAVFAANELFGNAIEHSESRRARGLVDVEVRRWRSQCAVLVTDQGGEDEPRTRPDEDSLSEGGRGLRIMGESVCGWGWYGNRRGRTVVAVFSG